NESLAGRYIANHDTDIRRTRAAADREAVEVRGDVGYLIDGECEFRHSSIAAVQQNGTDRLAFLIVQHKLGSKQVGSVVTSAGIGPMAEAAVDVEQNFSPSNRRWIRDRSLRICDETAASTRATGCLRILCGSRDGNNASGNAD